MSTLEHVFTVSAVGSTVWDRDRKAWETWHNLPLITECIGVDVREVTSRDWLWGLCGVLGGLYVDNWIALGSS